MTAAPAKEPFLNPRTAELLKKYIIGGGALGAGIGLTTSLANQLNYLRQKSKNNQEDSSQDDDILYVNMPKQANATLTGLPGVGSGIALAGGTVSLLAANAMVKKLYAQYKKRQLQNDLDEAQQIYWNQPIQKGATVAPVAGKPVSMLETVSGTPVALTLLAALASGVVANKTLSHYFPARDKKDGPLTVQKPKQVKIRYVSGADGGQEKSASAEDIEYDLLLKDFAMISTLDGIDKEASYFPDLVYAIAQGRLAEIQDNFASYTPETALDMVKGASQAYDATPEEKWAAVSLMNRTEDIAPVASQLFAAEMYETLPFFTKLATTYAPDDSDALVKSAATAYAQLATTLINEYTKEHDKDEAGKEDTGDPNVGYSVLSQLTEAAKSSQVNEEREEDLIDHAITGK